MGTGGRSARPPSASRWMVVLAIAAQVTSASAAGLPLVEIVGDAIPRSLTGQPGDAARGRALVVDRQRGLCLLCHTGPFPEERFQGTLAPDMAGAGARWSEGQLRLRIVDSGRLNPDTVMPSYYRIEGLTRVARAWEGRPVLNAQEIEDVISFLQTLRD
jgi:sulfur-oxidizing protein SoxX